MAARPTIHPLFHIMSGDDCVDRFKKCVEEHPNDDIRTLRFYGNTIISLAIEWARMGIFEYLITSRIYGIDEVVDDHEITILHKIVIRKQYKLIDIMMKHGVNPNARNSEGQTPLFDLFYISSDDYDVFAILDAAKQLISHGIDVNATDIYGKTALFYVMSCGGSLADIVLMIDLLIENGANMSIKDNRGHTAADNSCRTKHTFRYFLELNAPFKVSEKNLKKILMFHVKLLHHEVVKLLLNRSDIADRIYTILTSDDTVKTLLKHLESTQYRYKDNWRKHKKTYDLIRNVMIKEKTNRLVTLQRLCFAHCIRNDIDMQYVPKYIIEENRVFLSNCVSGEYEPMKYPDIIRDAIRMSSHKRQRC